MRLLVILMPLIFLLSACDRARNSQSHLVIQTPTNEQLLKSKVSAYATIPINRKKCYGVNIYGPGIETATHSCSPSTGVVSGFVEEGASLEAIVSRGSQRTIELYMLLLPAGSTEPCPKMNPTLTSTQALATYLVGTAQNIDLLSDTQTVTIDVEFPGVKSPIARQFTANANCGLQVPTGKIGWQVSNGSGTAQSSQFILKAQIGRPTPGSSSSGGSFILNGNITQ